MGNDTSTPAQTQSSIQPRREYTFKIVIVGDKSVGKTALITRMVHGLYAGKGQPTQGVEFALLTLHNFASTGGGDPNAIRRDDIRLMLWDIGGDEKFSGKTRFYYQNTVAAVVVVDVSKPKTFTEAEAWVKDLRAKVHIKGPGGETLNLPIVMFVNKADLVTPKELSAITPTLKQLAKNNDLLGFWTCSAKEETDLSKPVAALITKLLEQCHSDEIKMERSESYNHNNLQPFELATNCAACQTEFSMFTWKYHCRNCGLVFCSSCSPHSMPLRDKGLTSPVKVCVNCYNSIVSSKKNQATDLDPAASSSSSSLSSNTLSSKQRTAARSDK